MYNVHDTVKQQFTIQHTTATIVRHVNFLADPWSILLATAFA